MWPFTVELFQLVVALYEVKWAVTVLCIWLRCSARDLVTASDYTNKLRKRVRNSYCKTLEYIPPKPHITSLESSTRSEYVELKEGKMKKLSLPTA